MNFSNLQVRDEELDGCRSPDAATQTLRHLNEARAVALDGTDGDHDDVCVGEQLGRMGHAVMNLLCSIKVPSLVIFSLRVILFTSVQECSQGSW